MDSFRVINGPRQLKYHTVRKDWLESNPPPPWMELKGEIDVVDRKTAEQYKRVMVKFNRWHPSYWMRRQVWRTQCLAWQYRLHEFFGFLRRWLNTDGTVSD